MRSYLRYSIATLLFAAFCIAGTFCGYRFGYQDGYGTGAEKRESERPYVKVYSLADVLDLDSDKTRSQDQPVFYTNHHEWTEYLIDAIHMTVASDTWENMGGGPGTMIPGPDGLTIIVYQTADIHEEIANLLRDYTATRDRVERAREDAIERWRSSQSQKVSKSS